MKLAWTTLPLHVFYLQLVIMFSKEAISQRVSDLKRLHQKTTEWKISALEAADSMKETVAIAFMSEDDAGALEMIEAMVKKQGEPSFLMHCSQESRMAK